MPASLRALTLDLDDTLWPFSPIGARIEHVLHAWFESHSPRTAAQFPIPAMRRLRDRVIERHPTQAHDASWLRKRSIELALEESGSDAALADVAYAAFFAERNRVAFYPDALPALRRLATRLPICAVTNGNADLDVIGIADCFVARVTARDVGAAKPDPGIFLHACERLGVAPHQVLHIGDDVDADVVGAKRAGLHACWLHRDDAWERWPRWPARNVAPDLTFSTLIALADWLDDAVSSAKDLP